MSQTDRTLVILGAGGDLAARLLLPALGQLLMEEPQRDVELIGAGQERFTQREWLQRVTTAFATSQASGAAVDRLLKRTRYLNVDLTQTDGLVRVLALCTHTPALYFAVPPQVAVSVCEALGSVSLPPATDLALEKPFGTDGASAAAFNALLTNLVPEERIHRVDHFLGRSTVFNLLGLRFANRIFEPIWNNNHIQRVDIIYDEQLGLESRAGYYDHAGALVDMIQSHLLQVLAVVAMEPPSTLNANDLRDAKGLVLRATRVQRSESGPVSRRARYTAGSIQGRTLPAYVDEPGVDANNHTETLAEITVEIDNWRWAGVPFTLRSGKGLGERRREIVITFQPASHTPVGLTGPEQPTTLRIFLAPDEMCLDLNLNGPGDPFELQQVSLTAQFGPGQLLAYGEVLAGILDADPSLSVRGDTAEQCWKIVAPVLTSWRNDAVPLSEYAAGSAGPTAWASIG